MSFFNFFDLVSWLTFWFVICGTLARSTMGQSFEYIADEKIVHKTTLELMQFKRQHKAVPYKKFTITYDQIHVCGGTRVAKLFFCNTVLTDQRYEYTIDQEKFYNFSCRPTKIEIYDAAKGTLVERKVIAYKCPTPTRVEKLTFLTPSPELRRTSVSYYISNAVRSLHAIVYYRYFGLTDKIRPDIAITKFPVHQLRQLELEKKAQTYAHDVNYGRKAYDEVLSDRVSAESMSTTRSPIIPERKVAAFIQNVKKNERPYGRFTTTYNALNLCSMAKEKLLRIWALAFENHAYGMRIVHDIKTLTPCQRRVIYFEFSSSKPTDVSLVSGAFEDDPSKNSYFISSIGSSSEVIVYMQIQPHKEILADGLVSNVDPNDSNESVSAADQLQILTGGYSLMDDVSSGGTSIRTYSALISTLMHSIMHQMGFFNGA